jgi:hypothetical protein
LEVWAEVTESAVCGREELTRRAFTLWREGALGVRRPFSFFKPPASPRILVAAEAFYRCVTLHVPVKASRVKISD